MAGREAMNLRTNKVEEDIPPLAFRWVLAAVAAPSSSSSLTIEENNKMKNISRAAVWTTLVFVPAMCVAISVLIGSPVLYEKIIWEDGFPWFVPVVMRLAFGYMAVVQLAIYHMTLFLPRAPQAAWEALAKVGLVKIGIPVTVSSGVVVVLGYYGARWVVIIWCCLVGALIAAVLAFWICLALMYDDQPGRSCAGLAIGLALSGLFAAAVVAFFNHLVLYRDQTS